MLAVMPREGGLRLGENFWLRLLQPARSVCVSLSAFFIGNVLLLNSAVRKLKLMLSPPVRFLATLPGEN